MAIRAAAALAEGDYEVAVDGRLEDLAGNTLEGLFDRPPGERVRALEEGHARLNFTIDDQATVGELGMRGVGR